jgi:AGZA family xanthine/uracil permease-like MFS transporter
MLEKVFGLTARETSVRTEVLAGATTFLTMAYIIFVNPKILASTGMNEGAVFVATCLAAAIGSALMGLWANLPVAQAPGMGLNAFFAFVVVKSMGVSWEVALAAVFCSGVAFLVLSVLPFRQWLINSIPMSQKLAIAAGIGLFLGIIALESAGVIKASPATLVTVGNLKAVPVLLAALGFFVIVALDYRKIPGAILIGIVLVTVIGIAFEVPYLDGKTVTSFKGVVALPPDPRPTLFALDFAGLFELGAALAMILVFSFLLVDLFDTAGTLIGLGHQAGMLTKDGRLPGLGRALVADSSASIAGALLGTSTTTAYIESASGIRAGGRTGLTAATAALLFLLALFLSPLAASIPPYATAPAILFVACVMMRALGEIGWTDLTEAVPAAITLLAVPLTFSITTGIGLGFIAYAVIKILSGRWTDINAAILLITAAFVLHFWIG